MGCGEAAAGGAGFSFRWAYASLEGQQGLWAFGSVDAVEAGIMMAHGWRGLAVLAWAVAYLLVLTSSAWAARYRVGEICGDPVADPGPMVRAFQYMYPRGHSSGGVIGLELVSVSSTGVLSYTEKLPSGSTVTGTTQLVACNYIDCRPSAQTVSPCPSGFSPVQGGGSILAADVVAYSSAFDKLPQQDVFVAMALVGLAAVGFGLGYKVFAP